MSNKWLEIGAKIELEHTKDIEEARKIAQDHLNEDPDYYKDWEDKEKILFQEEAPEVKKEERLRVDKEIDGKQELDYGEEELDKEQPTEEQQAQAANQDAQQDYDLKMKWLKLKKAMADDAFVTIGEDEDEQEIEEEVGEPSEEELGEEEFQHLAEMLEQEEEVPQGEIAEDPEAAMMEQEEVPQEEVPQGEIAEDPEAAEQAEMEQAMMAEAEGQPMEASQEEEVSVEELEEIMRELGHSDAEIAHVLHGHFFPDVDEITEEKVESERAKREGELSLKQIEMQIKQADHALNSGHAGKMNDLDVDHKRQLLESEREHDKRMKELEYLKAQKDIPGDRFDDAQHQQRMMDLAYEKAQREMELDLQIKMQQAELKMKQAEEDAKYKAREKSEKSK